MKKDKTFFSSIKMFKEWFETNIEANQQVIEYRPTGEGKEPESYSYHRPVNEEDCLLLSKFLDENSTVCFSDEDIDFFLKTISRSDNKQLGVKCLNHFMSNNKRVLQIIRWCIIDYNEKLKIPKDDRNSWLANVINILGLSIYYEKITEKNPHYLFLFKKFPLKIFETILAFGGAPYWSEGVDIFYFLCGVYQSHIIYHKALNRQCLNPSTFVSKVCEFLPREKFIEYIPILTKYNGIKQHIKRKRKLLLERVKNIVEINYTYPPHQVSYSTFIIERIILERVAHSSKN